MTILTEHQKAALDFDRHISLTANAGSGKTFVLSKRYLEIALSQSHPNLRNIAAISFTDKAAGELYKKIAGEIEDRLKIEKDAGVKRKLTAIRRQLVSANISTIHSFCIDILREFPVEAGLDANFSPIDEQLSDELIELSVDELIRKAFNDIPDEEKIKYVIRILGSKSIFTRELIQLIKNRKNVFSLGKNIYGKSIEEIAGFFDDQFLKSIEELFSNKIPHITKIIDQINLEVLGKKADNNSAVEISALVKGIATEKELIGKINLLNKIAALVLTKSGTVRKRGYLSKEHLESFSPDIVEIESFFPDLKYIEIPENKEEVNLELANFGKTLICFFDKGVEIYNGKKKENAYLDYEDILLFVQRLLENPLVCEALSKKYHFIMIDEYQDTNEIQYNIFLPILDHLRKGNLFVVGDEKQSIYKFRDAELEVFNRTKDDIEKTVGENKLLTLPESFRMAPAISLFTNKLFSKLFANPDPAFNEVEYTELISASDTETNGSIEILLSDKNGEAAAEEEIEEGGNEEDEIIANRVLKLVNEEGAKFSDIAILCRRRREFKGLENTFVKYKIPFLVVGGKGFYQRQSIYDIYNYFSFLLDYDNDTALVGTLRSPFFNLSDSVIYEISLEKGDNFWSKFRNYSIHSKGVEKYVNILAENIKLSTSYDLTSLLRKILDESPFVAVIASRSNSEQELANIHKLVSLTTHFNSMGFKNLYDYVSSLKDSINQLEDESQAVITSEANSVKIMTYHQAKGLEFKAVFLHKSDEPLKKESIKSKSISVDKKFGLLTKVPVNNNISAEYQKAPVVGIYDLIETRKNLAEFKRLFYVGVTRAIEYLFICGRKIKDYNYDNNSILGMLASGFGLDFNSDELNLSSKLKFAKAEGNKFITNEKEISTTIKVTKTIDKVYPVNADEITIPTDIKLNAQVIKDQPEGEFISATKVAVYKQCPLKYQLTYEFGFTKLFNSYKTWIMKKSSLNKSYNKFEFSDGESAIDKEIMSDEKKEKNNYSDVKGRIIHKLLQKEINKSECEEFIIESLKNELDVFDYTENLLSELKSKILGLVTIFLDSSLYRELKLYKNYRNEFEIYIKENDYFLYGIIDKLIIEENKFIIIDYKTDDITEQEIKERAEAYLPQLEFYSYIVKQYFNKKCEIELKIAFIKHPDMVFSKTAGNIDFEKIGKEIKKMVINIREGNFSKNLDHCSKCLYAIRQEKCIIGNLDS
jgi:ATP-dependent helicase/nuclease subunit A